MQKLYEYNTSSKSCIHAIHLYSAANTKVMLAYMSTSKVITFSIKEFLYNFPCDTFGLSNSWILGNTHDICSCHLDYIMPGCASNHFEELLLFCRELSWYCKFILPACQCFGYVCLKVHHLLYSFLHMQRESHTHTHTHTYWHSHINLVPEHRHPAAHLTLSWLRDCSVTSRGR